MLLIQLSDRLKVSEITRPNTNKNLSLCFLLIYKNNKKKLSNQKIELIKLKTLNLFWLNLKFPVLFDHPILF